ncbi:MAG: CPBP family intramembrane metalloprotease [Kiritimatiellae bacterium]|nr:CPBP family intramembrane metalloprotease [Kiritimatiellia bacterium]
MSTEKLYPASAPRVRAGGWRWLEALLLYGGIPVVWAWRYPDRIVLPVLWVCAVPCAVYLLLGRKLTRSQWGWGTAVRADLTRILLRFLAGAAVMTLLLAWVDADVLFGFPRSRPRIWMAVCVLYPPLSVYPQGIVYRAFLVSRYGHLLPQRVLPWAAAIAFAWAHIVFANGWALLFTFIGGWMFHDTWTRTRSLMMTAVEQSLYGLWLFTLGWGAFFYHGTLRWAERAAGS